MVERRRLRGATRAALLASIAFLGIAMMVSGVRDLVSGSDSTTDAPEVSSLPPVPPTAAPTVATTVPDTTAPTESTTTVPPPEWLVDPASVRTPWGTAVDGVLTYRGNPTRSFWGTGPVPRTTPQVLWSYPQQGNMCGESSEYDVTRVWCGTGWTGQPAVFEREGRTWVVFGAYDYKVHFVDAATGADIIPPFPTGDLAKGNVTVDPDGYPLVYVGSRDDYLRVIAFDGTAPRELWKLSGRTDDRKHNDDWDGAPLVLADHLLEGGENSWFYGIRLNRGYATDGSVTVAPEVVFREQGWDDQVIRDLAGADPNRLSIESSVMVSGDTAFFNTSGGLVQGWDVSSLRTGDGAPTRTFRFWTGDDGDATIVADEAGFLYVGVEVDRNTSRAKQVGQLLKLDPRSPDDPVVWAIDVNRGVDSGTWGAPVVLDSVVIWTTKRGGIFAYDRDTGTELWTTRVSGNTLSSPVYVDGVLLQADGAGVLHAFDLPDPRTAPTPLWQVALDGNIESTPTVWKGRIYVGDRSGRVYCIGAPT